MLKRNARIYKIYHAMKYRCYNENSQDYKYYGGKGITICSEWLDNYYEFEEWALKNGYENSLTIDRENNNKNYNPNNCRWVSRTIQTRNTRVLRKDNKSGYRGVHRHSKNKFRSLITVDKKRYTLGLFDTAIEAAVARDKYVLEHKLEHTLNGVI